jgi:hypothetical protein
MVDHVTEEELRAFRDRTLNNDEWWHVTEHTSVCAVCRERLGGGDAAVGSARAVLQRFDELLPLSSRHLSEEEILAWVEKDLTDVDRSAVEAHLAACANCRTEVDEASDIIGQFALADSRQMSPAHGRLAVPAWAWATAAALLLSMGTSVYLLMELSRQTRLRSEREQRFERQLAERSEQIARLERELNAQAPGPGSIPVEPPEFSFELQPRGALTRGTSSTAPLPIRIPANMARVRLSFEFTPEKAYPRYHIDLQNADGDIIWSRAGFIASARGAQRVVTVSVPGRIFASEGRYTAILRGIDAEGVRKEAADYAFRVVR